MIRFIVLCFCIVTLFYSITAEVVKIVPCDGHENQCIDEVRVEPCKNPGRNGACKVKKGTKAAIEVDFTPPFSSRTLKSQAFWDNGLIDIPFLGMDTDACKTTTCPVTKGVKQTYKYNLHISEEYPTATFNLKWKLTGENSDDACCFGFKIKLLR